MDIKNPPALDGGRVYVQKKLYKETARSSPTVLPCNLPSLSGLMLKVSLFNFFVQYSLYSSILSTLFRTLSINAWKSSGTGLVNSIYSPVEG